MIAHGGVADQAIAAAVLLALTAGYAWAWTAHPAADRTSGRPPLAPWLVGTAAVLVADSGPMRDLADRTFTGHMVQHLLILCVAAPAFVLARPGRVVGAALRGTPTMRNLERWLRPLHGAEVILGPLAAIVILVVIHLTSIYDAALRSPIVHHLEHGGFLLAGVGLWVAVLAPRLHHGPWRVVTSFAVVAVLALLGMVLTTGSVPLSEVYAERSGVAAALDDQRRGAALMWVGGMALTLPLVLVAVWRWASAEDQAQRRREDLAARARAAVTAGDR